MIVAALLLAILPPLALAGLDPSLAHEARELIRSVRVRTPACLLSR